MSTWLLLLFKKKRMEEFSYLPVTNFELYPGWILFLTSTFLGLKNQKTKPLPFRTGFHWVSATCCNSCYGVGCVTFPSVFWGSVLSPLLHHSTCLCCKRQMCSDVGRIPRNKLLFFSYCLLFVAEIIPFHWVWGTVQTNWFASYVKGLAVSQKMLCFGLPVFGIGPTTSTFRRSFYFILSLISFYQFSL